MYILVDILCNFLPLEGVLISPNGSNDRYAYDLSETLSKLSSNNNIVVIVGIYIVNIVEIKTVVIVEIYIVYIVGDILP